MCIFNGAFALWVSGRVRKEAPSDQVSIVAAKFDRHGSVCKRRCGCGADWEEKEGEAPLGWILPVWLHGWLTGWLAEDEYCMVPCSRGQVTGLGGRGSPPPTLACHFLSVSPCIPLSLFETTSTVIPPTLYGNKLVLTFNSLSTCYHASICQYKILWWQNKRRNSSSPCFN